MNDTPPSVEKFYHDKLMERSPEERFLMGARMFEAARRLVLASLPADLSRADRLFNLFLRFYGHEFDKDKLERIKNHISGSTN